MNLPRAIGGYPELDLRRGGFPHDDGLLLNSGRACMHVLLEREQPVCVHVPQYTCDVVLEPIQRLGLNYRFYPIGLDLRPSYLPEVGDRDILIVNNYFGIQDAWCAEMAQKFGSRLLLDYSQAFFAPPAQGAYCFYTPRKFCGVPDGGILTGPDCVFSPLTRATSWFRATHLLQRTDKDAEAGYAAFQGAEASLLEQPPLAMSALTERLLRSYDHDAASRQRTSNFRILDERLGASNRLVLPSMTSYSAPMVYPYLTKRKGLREKLLDERVFVARYWPNIARWCEAESNEHTLMTDLLPLPLDQRYDYADMQRMLEIIG